MRSKTKNQLRRDRLLQKSKKFDEVLDEFALIKKAELKENALLNYNTGLSTLKAKLADLSKKLESFSKKIKESNDIKDTRQDWSQEELDEITKFTTELVEQQGNIKKEYDTVLDYIAECELNKDAMVNSNSVPNLNTESIDVAIKMENELIEKLNSLWEFFKQYIKKNPEFKNLSDTEKLDIFRDKFSYSKIMEDMPIICRYLICKGQYSSVAFAKMLKKMRTDKHPPIDERPKDYNQEKWIESNANYVTYLFDHYHKHKHYSMEERKIVWDNTYKLLKGEFDDFKKMHKQIEEKVKEEKKDLSGKNVRELLERLQSGTQELDLEDKIKLLHELEVVNAKGNYMRMLEEFKKKYKPIDSNLESMGKGKEKQHQTITMTETADVDRMHEIDDKYKPAELRGMVPDYDAVDSSELLADSTVKNTYLADELLAEEVIYV